MVASDKLKIRDSIVYNKNIKSNIKVLCISDIHLSNTVGLNDINNIIKSIKNEKPNYICVVGDVVNNPKDYDNYKHDEVIKLFSSCAKIAKTFLIIGNHDFIDEDNGENKDIFKEINIFKELKSINNVYLLIDESYEDENIFIYGYMQKYKYYFENFNKNKDSYISFYNDIKSNNDIINANKNKVLLFLTHSPEPLNDKVLKLLSNYDLIVTGHMHNGCVPAFLDDIFYKNMGIVSPNKGLFPKIARGVVKTNGGYLILSGGWTKLHAYVNKFLLFLDRLCNRQYDIITITNNNKYVELKSSNRYINLKNL